MALAGKLCVLTGGTSGIGLATAEKLVKDGADLVLVGRDKVRGDEAVARLQALRPGASVRAVLADLTTLAELRRLGQELAQLPRIDVLLNNAGAIFRERAETADGFERTFALNHMGYYVLTRLLEAKLRASAPARVVNVASIAHKGATLDFADLQTKRGYEGWLAYRRSKLCNILFTRELARRLEGSGVTANCLHPGFVASRFGDNNRGFLGMSLAFGKRLLAISVERGAETPFYCASAPALAQASGLYFDKCRAVQPSRAAQDDEAARRLWDESARLAGIAA